MHRSTRLLQALIAAGFDVDEIVEPARDSPIMSSQQLSLVRHSNTLTPLLLAVDRNDRETTNSLIEMGCKVRQALEDGVTALLFTVFPKSSSCSCREGLYRTPSPHSSVCPR